MLYNFLIENLPKGKLMRMTLRSLIISATVLLSSPVEANEFDFETAFHAYLSLGGNLHPNYNVMYAKRFHKDVFEKYPHDQFGYEEIREEISELLNKKANEFDLDKTFTVQIESQFGDYDFEQEHFELHKSGGSGLMMFEPTMDVAVSVEFENREIMNTLKMAKEEGKLFLRSRERKFERGNETYHDRRVYLDVKFHIDRTKNKDIKRNGRTLVGTIDSFKLYSDKKKTKVLYEY